MSTFVIDKKQNRAYIYKNFDKAHDLGTIENALGKIIETLEKEYPANDYLSDYSIKLLNDAFDNVSNAKTLWGIKETGGTIQAIHVFLSERNTIKVTMQEVERFRIIYHLSIKHIPLNICDLNDGIQIKNVNSLLDIVFHLLYYYAYNNLKIKKCEHCDRWFATSSLKNKYCTRKSTFYGYTHLNCEQAVRNIIQEITRERKRIYNSSNNSTETYSGATTKFYEFQDMCDDYKSKIKEKASIKNLSDYWNYLKAFRNEV